MIIAHNSKKQGDVGLGRAIAYFSENAYTVSLPLTDSQDYDLIIDKENSLERVQVKTTNTKSEFGIYVANLRICGGNRSSKGSVKLFDKTKCEKVFVLCGNGRMYSIPSKEIHVKTCLSLGEKYQSFEVHFNLSAD